MCSTPGSGCGVSGVKSTASAVPPGICSCKSISFMCVSDADEVYHTQRQSKMRCYEPLFRCRKSDHRDLSRRVANEPVYGARCDWEKEQGAGSSAGYHAVLLAGGQTDRTCVAVLRRPAGRCSSCAWNPQGYDRQRNRDDVRLDAAFALSSSRLAQRRCHAWRGSERVSLRSQRG